LEDISGRKTAGEDIFQQRRGEQTARVAQDVAGKSAFQIPTDEFGLVKTELTDFRPIFTKQIQSTRGRGQTALQAEEAKSAYRQAVDIQNLGQYAFTGGVSIQGYGSDIPGASGNSVGAKAISLAMQAKNNGTPYVWGGNSLTKGVDCSGLVQQVYRQLGVEVPRQTYEQAKSGKRVPANTQSLRPGDLVFYRGNAHVGIYMGGGRIIHAANTKSGITVSNLVNTNGAPNMAVRPY
jgi:cell wall-associated NlpC family hydrolase